MLESIDTKFSLETIILFLTVVGLYYRLDSRNESRIAASEERTEAKFKTLREDMQSIRDDIHSLRDGMELLRKDMKEMDAKHTAESKRVETVLRGDIKSLETVLRGEIKGVEASLRSEIQFTDSKVDRANQRLARLEGMLAVREVDVELEPEI